MASSAGTYMKPVTPERLNSEAMKRQLYIGMKRWGRRAIKEFKKTVATWEAETPEFIYRVALHGVSHARSGPGPTTTIYLDGDEFGISKWNWLSEGTEEHEIWAGYYTGKSDKKVLAFSSSFKPKTPVGSVFSGIGGEGSIDTFKPYVIHPGITPRDLRGKLAETLLPIYLQMMEDAMERAVQDSGHAME